MKTIIKIDLLVYKISGEIVFIDKVKGKIKISTRSPEILCKGMIEYAKKMDMLSIEDLEETGKTSYEDISVELIKKEIEIEL